MIRLTKHHVQVFDLAARMLFRNYKHDLELASTDKLP